MERKSYTITLYKLDKRYKTGRSKVWYADFHDLTDTDLKAKLDETIEIASEFVDLSKCCIEHTEFRTVKNLMSGTDVKIAADTPLCCDPSSETYWSM